MQRVVVKLEKPDRSVLTMLRTGGMGGPTELLGLTKTDAAGYFSFRTSRRGPYDISCFRSGPYSGDGALDINPDKFIVIRYRPEPVPFSLRPGEKPPR